MRWSIYNNLTLVEIGVYQCGTTRGIMAYLLRAGVTDFTIYGVDSGRAFEDTTNKIPIPPKHFVLIEGDSAEVFPQRPKTVHWMFIDGCHCANHVMLDFLNYAPNVVIGGEVLFHDINEGIQGKFYQHHGPDIPDFGRAVRSGLTKLGLYGDKRKDWRFVEQNNTEPFALGGIAAFQKVQ